MSDLRYFNLSIPAPKRHALMRKVNPDWRETRRWTLVNYESAFGLSSRGFNERYGKRVPVLCSFNESSLPVRDVRFADEVYSGIDHNGWYTDNDGTQGVIRGIVARLSHGRFLSGYYWSDNGEFVLFVGSTFDDETKCARDADREAEVYAEQCRESNERFYRMQELEGLCESKESDLCSAWEDYRAVWSAFIENPKQHAKAAIRAREWVRELICDLRAFRRELIDATAAYEKG